jgi:hypothetical protein
MKKTLIIIGKWLGIAIISIVVIITASLYFFKDEICGIVINEMNKHLKAKVEVGKVDLTFWGSFPNLSVDFNHVFIQDAYQDARSKDTLFFSERVRLKFNPLDIWKEEYKLKKVEVARGSLQLRIRQDGAVNYDIMKPSEGTSSSEFEFAIEEVALEGLRLLYDNQATKQFYSADLNETSLNGNFNEERFDVGVKSDLKIQKAKSGEVSLMNRKKASLNLKVTVDKASGKTELPGGQITISGLPFLIDGYVDTLGYQFNVKSDHIQLADVVNSFDVDEVKRVNEFKGTGLINFDLDVKGQNETTSPAKIKCSFGVDNGSLKEPVMGLWVKNIDLQGEYSNVEGIEKEYLNLKDIRFTTVGGPFAGNLKLTKFTAPRYKGNANGNLDLRIVHALFRIPMVEELIGNVGVRSDFDIHTIVHPDESNDYKIARCEGDVDLRNIQVKLIDDKRVFKRVNGRLYLRNDEAGIDGIKLELGGSDLELDGVFRNLVPFLRDKGNLKAEVEIKSNRIDVADLGSTSKEEKFQDGRKFLLPNNLEGSVVLDVRQLKYEKHLFKDIRGNMVMGNRTLFFNNMSLINADARIFGELTIQERTPEIFHLITKAESSGINFKSLFREWDNFEQEVITEDNISGKAQAKIYLEAPFDFRSGIILASLKSEIDLRIENGRLKNVEAFREITKSLKTSNAAKLAIGSSNIETLEKKLLDLKFETLENRLIIKNKKIQIPVMNINSSALDLKASGSHTFDNEIDYKFAFRFRDLKEKDKVSEFGEEEDDGTGMWVYMRMYGSLDNPTIEWDKDSKKQQAKENRQEEKNDVKSILKTEFGLFKSDTAVKIYQEKKKPQEKIEFDFGTEEQNAKKEELEKIKKDSKLKNKLKQMKEESEKDKQVDWEFN